MIVVIPSCRQIRLEHLEPLIEHGARFFVIDDTEGSIRVDHPQFQTFHWGDRRRLLGDHEIAIPKRNGACRDLGFYLAWKEGDADEIVIAIDDDCVVEHEDFPAQVAACLGELVRPEARGQGRHFNIFDLFDSPTEAEIFPRGFPYSARVDYREWEFSEQSPRAAKFNLGLWRGAFDINAIDKTRLRETFFPGASLRAQSVTLPPGALISVCSGNMHFRRELIPAVYQLPMHVGIMQEWTIDRYGDIWAGFLLKTLMDVRGDVMSAGGPMVFHSREAKYEGNLPKEHLAHLVNEEFLEILEELREVVAPGDYLEMMTQAHEHFLRRRPSARPMLRSYLDHLTPRLGAWISALN